MSDKYPMLTAAEIEAAKVRARRKVEEALKKSALAEIEDDETERLRAEEGLVKDIGPAAEMVDITLDLADHSDRVTIDGEIYFHGHTYTMTRAKADTIRDIMYRGHRHQELEIEGKKMVQHYARRHDTVLSMRSGMITNPPTTH